MAKQKHHKRRKHLENIREVKENQQDQLNEESNDEEEIQLPPTGDDLRAREAARRTLVEQRIQQAMNEGAFDNLSGYGKPLNLKKNPYTDSDWGLAYDLLQNNDLAPEWIERDKEIRRLLEAAHHKLALAWQQCAKDETSPDWQRAVEKFSEQITKLNRKINDFNLIVPILSSHRPRLNVDKEIAKVQEGSIYD